MTDNINKCIDCEHIYEKWGDCCCKSPKNVKPKNELVGCKKQTPFYTNCIYLRGDSDWCGYELCGPSGKWFEPKKPKKSFFDKLNSFITSS